MPSVRSARSTFGALMLLGVIAACGPRRISLPTDPGTPLPDFAAIQQQLSSACTGVRTLTAELGLSGRASGQRLRGQVAAGFERPASMRLEGVVAGQRIFILTARDGSAVLLLTRDNSVVRNASPEAILDALTGIALAPADLQAILTGCVVPAPKAVAGKLHGGGWASIELAGGATLYLQRRDEQWQLRAARRGDWEIEYPAWQGALPQSMRLRSGRAGAEVDMTAAISQLETNIAIVPAAFAADVPAGARTMTVEELRREGPLR